MARQPDDKPAAKFKSDDSALIRELALLLDETSLTEIEIERAGLRVRVARNVSIAASMPANFQTAASAPAGAAPAFTPRRSRAGGRRGRRRRPSPNAPGPRPPPSGRHRMWVLRPGRQSV